MCHGFRLTKLDDYFESILTTFEASVIFRGGIENLLKPKTKPPSAILAGPICYFTCRKKNLNQTLKCCDFDKLFQLRSMIKNGILTKLTLLNEKRCVVAKMTFGFDAMKVLKVTKYVDFFDVQQSTAFDLELKF